MEGPQNPTSPRRTRLDRCPGSGGMLVDGRCAVCYQIVRSRSGGGAAVHCAPAWLTKGRAGKSPEVE